MAKSIAIATLIIGELLLCQAASHARPIEQWPYDKLLQKSDLVVFATAIQTEAADDKWSPYPSSWPHEFAAQNTTFKVIHALKGKVESEQIQVLHFKFGELKKGLDPLRDATIVNGPHSVEFRTKPVTVTVGKGRRTLPAPEYLLFLRRGQDGRYEPVSGRIDPVLSVKEVYEASDSVPGGK